MSQFGGPQPAGGVGSFYGSGSGFSPSSHPGASGFGCAQPVSALPDGGAGRFFGSGFNAIHPSHPGASGGTPFGSPPPMTPHEAALKARFQQYAESRRADLREQSCEIIDEATKVRQENYQFEFLADERNKLLAVDCVAALRSMGAVGADFNLVGNMFRVTFRY